ncbi:MAG: hypothetical protein Q4D06_00120 [Coriobacteriia bacterium]|nr:hypothetical protein [Coriobacteriia bacterium]
MRHRILSRALGIAALSSALALGSTATALADLSPLANGGYEASVTTEMTTTDYWAKRTYASADALMGGAEHVAAVNQAAIDGSGTAVIDITHDYKIRKTSRPLSDIPTRALYANGQLVDNTEYFTPLVEAINTNQWEE